MKRFVLHDASYYAPVEVRDPITSVETWEECRTFFKVTTKIARLPRGYVLRDTETGREWLPNAAYDWEAAGT